MNSTPTQPTPEDESQESQDMPDQLGPTVDEVMSRIFGWDPEIDGHILRITLKNGKIKEEHYPFDTGNQYRKRMKDLKKQGHSLVILSGERITQC